MVEPNNEPLKFPHLKRMVIQHLLRLPYGRVVIRAFDGPDRDELLVHVANRINAVLWHDTFAHLEWLIARTAFPEVCPEVNTTASGSVRWID
jgi:hypothetical protein